MATHSSVLACRIPGMGEPGGLLSMGSHRVGHDGSHLAAAAESMLICNMEDEEEVVPGKSLLSDSQAEVGKDQNLQGLWCSLKEY